MQYPAVKVRPIRERQPGRISQTDESVHLRCRHMQHESNKKRFGKCAEKSAHLDSRWVRIVGCAVNVPENIALIGSKHVFREHMRWRMGRPRPSHARLSICKNVLDVRILSGQSDHQSGASYGEVDELISNRRIGGINVPVRDLRQASDDELTIDARVSCCSDRAPVKLHQSRSLSWLSQVVRTHADPKNTIGSASQLEHRSLDQTVPVR
jgi:hypothetical protein